MPRKGTVLSDYAAARNRQAIKAWHKEHTVAISFRVRKEKQPLYKQLAELRGESLSGIIQGYLDEQCRQAGLLDE